MIHSVERVVSELSEDERTRIMSDPWTLPEDIASQRGGRKTRDRAKIGCETDVSGRENFAAKKKELRELQKVLVEEQDLQIDRMAVKYRMDVLQKTLKKLHEDSDTLCDFAVKARRLACVKLRLVSPAEARNIRKVYEALPMKNWLTEGEDVPASNGDNTNDDAEVKSTPESCCVRESGGEEEEERQRFLTPVSSSQRVQPVHKGRGRKRKNPLTQSRPNVRAKTTKFFGSQQ